jgi:hypothetical protein
LKKGESIGSLTGFGAVLVLSIARITHWTDAPLSTYVLYTVKTIGVFGFLVAMIFLYRRSVLRRKIRR